MAQNVSSQYRHVCKSQTTSGPPVLLHVITGPLGKQLALFALAFESRYFVLFPEDQ